MKLNFSLLRRCLAFVAVLSLTGGKGSRADEDMAGPPDPGNLRAFVELARRDVRKEKALILAQNISFTEDEAISFWPIYSEYEVDLGKWYDRRRTLVKEYFEGEKMLTEEGAQKLAADVFKLEEERTGLKRTYYKKFSKAVGAVKAVRFFQIENQLNAAIDLYLAAMLPLLK